MLQTLPDEQKGGMSMALPEEPCTRVERYLARLSGQNVDIPEYPITRIECYLDYLCGNGGGVPAPNAGAHNGVFRGQSLGTSFTSAQSQAITAGTFEGLYVGDYWTIEGVIYRIAGLDYYYHRASVSGHHAVIVPDSSLYATPINSEANWDGGYTGSEIKTQGLDRALALAREAFGEAHVIPRTEYLLSASTSTGPSNWAQTVTYIDLMTEGQVLGRGGFGTQNQNGYNIGASAFQLPLFDLAPEFSVASPTSWFWLRDMCRSSYWTAISDTGNAVLRLPTNTTCGVRPMFLVA